MSQFQSQPSEGTGAPAQSQARIRIFTSPQKYSNAPLTIGRSHASWFLVFARPFGMRGKRADLCLNIVTSDPRIVSSSEPPHFFVGGPNGQEALQILQMLKDSEGRAPATVLKRYRRGERADGIEAEVRVDVPKAELAHACARCGKWELGSGPRFQRCSGCKARHYCSQTCQKEDWKPEAHKGDCRLLKESRAYEVEQRRGLHDNNSFMNGLLDSMGSSSLMDQRKYMNALDRNDFFPVGYGQASPPRARRGYGLDPLYDLMDHDDLDPFEGLDSDEDEEDEERKTTTNPPCPTDVGRLARKPYDHYIVPIPKNHSLQPRRDQIEKSAYYESHLYV